jgi:hypothetical protein
MRDRRARHIQRTALLARIATMAAVTDVDKQLAVLVLASTRPAPLIEA